MERLLFMLVLSALLACEARLGDSYAADQETHLWTAEQLQASLADEEADLLLIEVGTATAYATGHLPQAFHLERSDFTNSQDYAYGGMRLEAEHLAKLLGELGTHPETTILLYDDHGNVNAARLYWLLLNYGHQSVALLDGGKVAWEQNGNALTAQTTPPRTATNYQFSGPADFRQLAKLADVKTALTDTNTLIIDTREPEEYTGAPYLQNGRLYRHKNGASINGCIPSAIHLNWTATVDLAGDHRFLSLDSLQQQLNSLGISPDKKIIAYCHSGVRSAHFTFVLTELLRYPAVFNYDGSWIEWSYYHLNGGLVPIEQHTDSLSFEQRWQELSDEREPEIAL